jgi:hypothetical protein
MLLTNTLLNPSAQLLEAQTGEMRKFFMTLTCTSSEEVFPQKLTHSLSHEKTFIVIERSG